MKRTASGVVGLVLAVAVLACGLLLNTPAPAAAYACPPGSTLCTPSGLAVQAEYAAFEMQLAAAGSSATAGGSAVSIGATGAVGLGITVTGTVASHYLIDGSDPAIRGTQPFSTAGWTGGVNTFSQVSYSYGFISNTTEFQVVSAPAYGGTGTVTLMSICVATAGTGMGSLAGVTVYAGNGSQSMNANASCGPGSTPSVISQSFEVTNFIKVYGPGIEWLPVGHPSRENDSGSTSVSGTITQRLSCVNAGGLEVVVDQVASVVGSGVIEGALVALGCPAGSSPTGATVTFTGAGGSTTIGEVAAPEWVQSQVTEFPGCVDGGCSLELWKIVSGSPALFCGEAAVGCPEWWTDPAKAEHFECRYGPYATDLGRCGIFRKPGSIQPNQRTDTDTHGQVITVGDPVNSTNPGDYVDLDWKNLPDQVTPPGGGFLDYINPEECYPRGWGVFNPVEWVFRPVVCAMVKVWVPTTYAPLDGITDAVDASVLGSVRREVAALGDLHWPGSSPSCAVLYEGNPSSMMGETLTVTPCGPIALALAGVIRPLLSMLFWIGGVFLAIQAVLKAFDIDLMVSRAQRTESGE